MSSSYRFKHQGYFLWILLFLWHQPATYCQRGYFPDLRDLSALKPITSSSTCGAEAMDYCQSFRSNSSLQTCSNNTCQFACCSRCGSSKPLSTDLAKFLSSSGVASGEPRNGSSVNSYRFQANSYLQASSLAIVLDYVRTGVTLSVWMKQKAGNRGTIISKDQLSALHYANIFHLIIQDYDLTFHYVPIGRNSSLTVTYTLIQSQSEKLHPDEWHFITVSIIDKGLSYYIDGELMTANSVTLSGSINDPGGIVRIGQSYAGSDQYEGLMQDIFVYTQALTNREVIEAFTGVLPQEYVASHCRCPPTHPKIYPRGPTSAPPRCLRNVDGSLDDAVSRLADTAHPVELATDGDTLGFWLSELTENATIDIELSYSRLQVFYIVLTFYGPLPGAILIERSIDGGKMFQPWQYIAEDCISSFQLENNGQLSEPDDVNCIQYSNPFLATGGIITFRTEYPPPSGSNIPVRPFAPGCANLYCSEKLLQFIKATNVRFHFYNHTLVTNAQHRYYGLDRILVAGRCECFGHALTYRNVEGTRGQLGRCVCDCHPSTNTEGENCNRCQPLYNNKPFQRGNIVNAFPCIKCECNDHASRCVYNQTLDSQPSSRTLGGGGVCINCQHNTTGRFCELCKERYYRESGKNLTDREVCSPCGCKGPGVQSGKLDCVKDDSKSSVLAGQCDCKVNTMGRQCNICKDGFYNLSRSHPTGCIPCGCILDGTRNRSSSCHTTTGQCDCKDRVTGNTCNTCRTGFYGLTAQDPLGCKECSCDPYGTVAGRVGSCDAVTGDCSCKPGVIGRNCGQCSDGFHSLTQNGCSSCNCSAAGTPQSLVDKCNKDYGNCSCKLNVEGNNCDKCKPGFYNLMQFNPLGCTQCSCDIGGTVGGSGECDQQSGNCTCKRHVIGQQCNQCMLGTFGLNQSDPDGCRPCGCFPNGTVGGKRQSSGELPCFGNNGQCQCLSNVGGRQCDSCIDRHYWNPIGQGCVQCQCDHSVGSIGRNCNDTGHCLCRANIGGRQCDRCIDGYYGLSVNGWCTACNCDPAGSKNVRCLESGLCECKENVEGLKCDQCKSGTVSLQRNNTYGCSGAPQGENAMNTRAIPINSTAINVSWSPPQTPRGVIVRYLIFKYNATAVKAGEVPGSQMYGVVANLMPYTQYKFTVKACNNYDCTGHSPNAFARTLPAGM